MIDHAQDERAIFFAALQRPAGPERDAYLREACHGESGLLSRVRWLFSLHEQSQGPLDSPPPGLCIAATANQSTEQVGTAVGRYKLLEQVGEGGMGIVFVAEQTEPVRRRVALKIIKPGMDTKQVIGRFEAERQALAMMDHPNIARVLDAGTTDAGRPYFVMELVRGMPITEYCDKARLSPRQRLELFVDVCQAVQHAHQKGIIHRDLKPSNVLVTMQDGRPVVKVIDFGVAKAVGQQLTERTVYTALTQLVGTPLYMSPEQAELTSHDVDTRSDVYSLGVLLYELLTGQTPFDKETLSKAGLDEMRRMIREDEPLRPSHRVSTLGAKVSSTTSQQRGLDERHLGRVLRGELDWIVMKALEKDRSRRYESASGLAADIQRYLSDEPVLACPPTTMYRFQKFARKHKPAFATAGAIAICLILGTTVSAWQAVRATTAEAQANANEAQAQASAQEAKTKAQEATIQRDEAQKQRDEVKALADKLAAKEQQLQQTLYASHMNLTQRAWDAGGIGLVNELLEQHRPKPGETDLRGFEWHYLYKLCHPELLTFKGGGVAFSQDGKRMAIGTKDGVRILDTQTNRELFTLLFPDFHRGVAFSPDGKRLAATRWGSDWGEVKVWDAQTGEALHVFKGQQGVWFVAFSPDGKRLASVGCSNYEKNERSVLVRDSETGQEIFSIPASTSHNNRVAFSPDGKRLAIPDGREVRVWDAQTGQELLTLKGSYGYDVAFSPDGKRLASNSNYVENERDQGDVKVWDAQTGEELLTFKGRHKATVKSLAFSPDGKRLASASDDKTVKVWDAQTGAELLSVKGHFGSVDYVVFNHDGTRLASNSIEDGTVRVWNANKEQDHSLIKVASDDWRGDAFSPDFKHFASAFLDGTVKVRDVQTGQLILTLKGHAVPLHCVAFSPDGKRLASGGGGRADGGGWSLNDGDPAEIKVWDAQTGQELVSMQRVTRAVTGVAFSPDGKRLASSAWGRRNSHVKVWDAETGQELQALESRINGHDDGPPATVTYSHDGKLLACSGRGAVSVWDTQSGNELFSLQGGSGSAAFSPDSRHLASGGKVWDASTGKELQNLKGHISQLWCMTFSPDGKRIASGSRSEISGSRAEIKLWDAQTGQELLTFECESNVHTLAFSPSGQSLASVAGRTVKFYDATPLPMSLGSPLNVNRPDQADARAVLDKAIAAVGGEAKLAKFKARTWTENGAQTSPTGTERPYMRKYAVQWPRQACLEMGVTQITTDVFNGEKGWVKSANGKREMTAGALRTFNDEQYARWTSSLLPLKDAEFTLSLEVELKIDNRDAVAIRVSHKDHPANKLYFDKQSGLLVKCENIIRRGDGGGYTANREDFYANYREVDGIQVPMKVVRKNNNKVFIEADITEMKLLSALDDSVFAQP